VAEHATFQGRPPRVVPVSPPDVRAAQVIVGAEVNDAALRPIVSGEQVNLCSQLSRGLRRDPLFAFILTEM
jgi:hypothetical protein